MPFLKKLLNRYDILALPQFIFDEEFQHNLGDSTKNIQLAAVLKKESKIEKSISEEVTLQTSPTSVSLLDESNPEFPVAFVYLFLPLKFRGVDAVQEKYLWKDQESQYAGLQVGGKSLSRYTFFDVLLKRHEAVVSDIKHTKHGRGFWQGVLTQAFDQGLHVYVEAEKELFTFQKDDMGDLFSSFWGRSSDFQKVLLVVSRKELK